LRYFNAAGADAGGEIGEAHPVETHLIPLVLDAVAGRRAQIAIHGDDYDTRDGTCVRDYIHVEDLAAAHLLAVEFLSERDGAHAFNLGSGKGATVREIVEIARRISNRTVPIKTAPRRAGDPAVLLADSTQAQLHLGWKPVSSDLNSIVSSAWNWHKKSWQTSAA
jgi:UDP-glucose 4-epimerase